MKFLANENFPLPSVTVLRNSGFQVVSVCESFPGVTDEEVIEFALKNDFVILTFDKDYGEIIFKYGIEEPPAVVFFRDKGGNPTTSGTLLVNLLKKGDIEIIDKFTVIQKDAIRQRTYH